MFTGAIYEVIGSGIILSKESLSNAHTIHRENGEYKNIPKKPGQSYWPILY